MLSIFSSTQLLFSVSSIILKKKKGRIDIFNENKAGSPPAGGALREPWPLTGLVPGGPVVSRESAPRPRTAPPSGLSLHVWEAQGADK